jgi:hypothetical protein
MLKKLAFLSLATVVLLGGPNAASARGSGGSHSGGFHSGGFHSGGFRGHSGLQGGGFRGQSGFHSGGFRGHSGFHHDGFHHNHGHFDVFVDVPLFGFPLFWDPFFYPYYYPYSAYPYSAPVYVEQEPPVYIERGSGYEHGSDYWYYCADRRAYYPYVRTCPKGWLRVVPESAPPS